MECKFLICREIGMYGGEYDMVNISLGEYSRGIRGVPLTRMRFV